MSFPAKEHSRGPHVFDASHQGHKLTIAYRGTEFSGWQRQADKRTVQGCMEDALAKLWSQRIILQGSGRTDTGVHALGQVASFNASRLYTATVLQRALNANLPRDVRIMRCQLVPPSFHARFDTRGKTYVYLIANTPVQNPFILDTHWHVSRTLDFSAMRRAARHLLGKHDFASFTSNPGYERDCTVRTMERASLSAKNGILTFCFTADGFLYRMVRNLVGGLVKVGQGKLTAFGYGDVLRARSRSEAPASAPACGLYLIRVFYD